MPRSNDPRFRGFGRGFPFGQMTDAWAPMHDLRRQMERLFDDAMHAQGGAGSGPAEAHAYASTGSGQMASVRIDVSETETAIRVVVELPGVAEDDVEVTLTDNVLSVKGTKRPEPEAADEGRVHHLAERSFGPFERSFRLPDTVEETAVSAAFDKGVLVIDAAKSTKARERVRRINIGR